jgi:hypothetical protein
MSSFETDMNRLDEGLKALQVEYNRYFTGALDRPPYELQTEMEGLIRRHTAAGEGRRTAEQFRFNSLVARFHSLRELYNRNVRNIEEGRPSVLDRRESHLEDAPEPAEKEICTARVKVGKATPEHRGLQALYNSYLEAAGKSGSLQGTLSYRSFYNQLQTRLERHHERTGSDEVMFRVVLVDNRPLLKLRSRS